MTKDDLNNLVTIADLKCFSNKIIGELRRLLEKEKPEFYSPTQFSKKTGMPYTTVIHYCKNNLLKAHQAHKGGAWHIAASEIERLKEEAEDNQLNIR